MLPFKLLMFATSSCLCAVNFTERPQNFSIELLYHTLPEADGHIVLSPFGIWSLMTSIALGATGNSYNELAQAFILPKNDKNLISEYKTLTNIILSPPSSSGVSLTSKNFVFLDEKFSIYPQFNHMLQNDFAASIQVLDFNDPNSAPIANTYIEKSGIGVSNVLRSDDFQDSRMILTNVISFKGLWASPFNASDTALEPFYDENKVVIGSVNMMYQKGHFPFSYVKDIKAFVLELPYGTNNMYSMVIILPKVNEKINDICKRLAFYSLTDIFKKLKADEDSYGLNNIFIKLPRFKISTNLALYKPLNKMGVHDIFNPSVASFEQISKDNIFVSEIIHKAEIEVTESGTVASASSLASFSNRMAPPIFYCNKPFIYFLIEKSTATVIFSGIYSKPTVY